ncbi:MAG: TetR/AcrR family transcriptional regulator [Thermodesulfobacteriota bacterium]|nr:TetR/AcrR family transcriptional regulator [Thermodesulfobacteriota bacterium]
MEKRPLILKVATALFAARGFEATPVRKIAADAGLSVPGMFYYFSSKEEILFEIMIGFMEEAYKRLEAIIRSDEDPVKKLEQLCSFYVRRNAAHQEELTILNSEGKSLSPEHRKIFIEKQRFYVEALENILGRLAEQGAIKPIGHAVLTLIFYGMVHWTYTWYDRNGEVSPDELGKIISEVFLHGIIK